MATASMPLNMEERQQQQQLEREGQQASVLQAGLEEEDVNSTTPPSITTVAQQDARFSCNICFDAVSEPVVTRCGHLYCWPCLYRWLAPGMTASERASLGVQQPPRGVYQSPAAVVDQSRRVCPVCKADCSVPTLVPIYVRSSSSSNGANRNDKPPPSSSRQQRRLPEERQQHLPPPEHQQQTPPSRTHASSDFSSSLEHNDSHMGLDIDDNQFDDDIDLGLEIDEGDNHHHPGQQEVPTTITTTSPTDNNNNSLGIRQRRRRHDESHASVGAGELNSMGNTSMIGDVPTRPVPTRDMNHNNTNNRSASDGGGGRALSPVVVEGGAARVSDSVDGHARATLSAGLVVAMHQTLLQATSYASGGDAAGTASNSTPVEQSESIPSLHYPQHHNNQQQRLVGRRRRESGATAIMGTLSDDAGSSSPPGADDWMMDQDPASTIFLSRLLLGLSLFVLFCLLSF